MAIASLSEWFWREDVWLPPGTTWNSLRSAEIGKLPDFGDLLSPVYYSFLFLIVRAAFEWVIARPLGRYFGIVDTGGTLPHFFNCAVLRFRILTTSQASPNHSSALANGHAVLGADHKFNGRARSRSNSVSRIFQLIHQKSVLDKFAECCWRFTYYLGIFVYGLVVLWNKPWFWDTSHCWYGYPYQKIDDEIRWYYIIELSFYWSLMFSQFVDVVRKDFWVNFIHHVTTVLLLSFSWMDNFVRIGSLVLIVHDASDFWLEGVKMARYCKSNTVCNTLFIIFMFVWFVTRCGIYPFKIIYSTTVEAPMIVEFFAAYYIFNALLLVLFALQLFWSVLILKIAVNTARSGETDDVRSDMEDSSEEDGEEVDICFAKKIGRNNTRNSETCARMAESNSIAGGKMKSKVH